MLKYWILEIIGFGHKQAREFRANTVNEVVSYAAARQRDATTMLRIYSDPDLTQLVAWKDAGRAWRIDFEDTTIHYYYGW